MAVLKPKKNQTGLLGKYPHRPLLQALQPRERGRNGRFVRVRNPYAQGRIVVQQKLLTTRQFLILEGFGVFGIGLLFVALGSIPQQLFGVFLAVVGFLTALSSNLKGARKDIQKTFKTFMKGISGR